ncbi:uncharacterized protein LOC144667527 isoform X1 [Oculina patagonica]
MQRFLEEETTEKYFHNEGDCEIESARTARSSADFTKDPSPEANKAKETDHLSDPLATQYSSDYDTAESQNDGGPKSPSSLTRGPSSEPLPKEGSVVAERESDESRASRYDRSDESDKRTTKEDYESVESRPTTKGGRKSRRKRLNLLTRRQTKLHQSTMDRLMYEIAVRTQHKAKTLEFEAKNLCETVDNLRDENRSLKRLQRSQDREIHERHDFVDMANLSLKGFRRDVRFSEGNRVDAQVNTRKKNKKVMRLEKEKKRLEELVKLDSKLPSIEELELRIEKASRELEKKDEKLEDLQSKIEAQDQRVSQEQQKEKKRFVKLQHEIEETVKECHDLTTRIKVAERKIHKTNIYSRKSGPVTQSLPAITWHPPTDEQSATNKVEKWLNKHGENST